MTDAMGTEGRVYGGRADLVHIADGERRAFGAGVARYVSVNMRTAATMRGGNHWEISEMPLCMGCAMIALVDAALHLARDNGQSLTELGRTMSAAFALIADRAGEGADLNALLTEEIEVLLDPEE